MFPSGGSNSFTAGEQIPCACIVLVTREPATREQIPCIRQLFTLFTARVKDYRFRFALCLLSVASYAALASTPSLCSLRTTPGHVTASVCGPIRPNAPVVVVSGTRQPVTLKQLEVLRGDVNLDVRNLAR